MDQAVAHLLISSLKISALSIGGVRLLGEVFLSYLPLGILITVAIVGCVYYFRVPPPNPNVVEAILGKDLSEIETGSSEYALRTVAHRGAGLDAPENTLAAFKMCKDKSCDFIEFDVCLTADGVPIVFHDSSTGRLADSDLVINESRWADLCNVNLSAKHPFKDRYPQTNIPTLDQTVNQLLAAGQKMFIDIKDNDTKMVNVILNLFEKYPELESKALVTSFFPTLIYLIRRKNPRIVCSMAWRPYAFVYESFNYAQGPGPKRAKTWYKHCYLMLCDILHEWLLPRLTYYFLGLSVILMHKDALEPRAILDWRKKGVRVMAWTVNSPIEKQYLAKVLKITYLTDTFTGESSTHLAL
ncbi:glycerophosphodiester phosphodiesterase 1-like [Coccinella septempunctata]|uniref:glycerophosphodiester phosphodiesterase 1-like n=1 Tax=Coccinella septempunctata TaxID=41139 RepID=UPI001D074FB3|nr:glycerophosphodiester phosphodiesterase 1-like [Coccinella septempunctata]